MGGEKEGKGEREWRGEGEQNCSKICTKLHHFLTIFSGACPEPP